MPYGYAGKLAEIDLTREEITTTTPSEDILRQYIGGRGLAVKILWDRLGSKWRSIDPLGPENLFLALTGPATGYLAGARTCCSGKSPLSNGILGSTASSEFPVELRCAGYDGVIVVGKAKKPVYILVTDDGVEILNASHLWGLEGKETIKALNKEVRELMTKRHPAVGLWKEPAMMYIGPAGENRVRNAAVMTKWAHACGYGGYGAVMGSKNLKAIVAKGRGPLPEAANPAEVQALWQKMVDSATPNFWGTGAGGYTTGAEASAEPVRNWQEEWHNNKSIGAINFETRNWVKRYWADFGCPRPCLKLGVVKTGRFKGSITDNPDYELEAYCGTNFGIFETDAVLYTASTIDDLGHSGINGPNTIGFAAELFQRGILTKEDFGGIEPKWGDPESMMQVAKLIAERKAIGDVLAEGTYRAALKISQMKGVNVMPYAIQVKGVETGAHGVRTGEHFPLLGYALSVQAGDHTSVPRPPLTEANATIGDSLVYCTMSLGFGPSAVNVDIWSFLQAVTGWNITAEEWMNVNGRRIIQIQRAALLLGGPDVIWDPIKDDDNPPRWYTPLPSGPYEGKAPNRAEVMELRKSAYIDMGWDERGIPTTEELTKLGLQDVDEALKQLRK